MPDEDGRKATPSVASQDESLPEQLQRRKQALERESRGGYPVLTAADTANARQHRDEQARQERQRQELLKRAHDNSREIAAGRPGQEATAQGAPARVETRYPQIPAPAPRQVGLISVAPSPAGTVTESRAKPYAQNKPQAQSAAVEMTDSKVIAASKAAARETNDASVKKVEGVKVTTAPGLKEGFSPSQGRGRGD